MFKSFNQYKNNNINESQTMPVMEIDRVSYKVNNGEFNDVPHEVYNNLKIIDKLGHFERVISLLNELSVEQNISTGLFCNPTNGGFIPLSCSKVFKTVYITSKQPEHTINIYENAIKQDIQNLKWSVDKIGDQEGNFIMYSDNLDDSGTKLVEKYKPILLTNTDAHFANLYTRSYTLADSTLSLYIPDQMYATFNEKFKYFLDTATNVMNYDNLINLCIMVKNGGTQFEDMLKKNMHLADRWTILDTGSTDNTIDIINKVLVGNKKGNLYQEPFINFRDSRNRLLELAGQNCKYTLMLDDTYVIEKDLRGFLGEVRGDQIADSFSLYIKSDDVEYASNRILKASRKLKYLYRIHEVIQDKGNMNVITPFERAHIMDGRFDYMEERTMGRKELDLKFLYEELEEDPNNSRTHYYLGQTYNLLQNHQKAYDYFIERMNHPNEGFLQEKIDAVFEAARLANFQLNKPWELCVKLYLKAYELDKSRPDSLYFLGIHYFLENNKEVAFDYFKRAFEIGYPIHCQYSLKPTLSFHFLPKFLSQLSYEMNDFPLGERSAALFLEKNPPTADTYDQQVSWHNIFVNLNKMQSTLTPSTRSLIASVEREKNKPLFCFVADGGFEPWTGSDILVKGVGGSETYIIEMARYIQKQGQFKVIVFCNCLSMSVFEGVEYVPLSNYQPFAKNVDIHTCVVSRFSEYIPVAIHGKVENLYLVLHDLTPSGVVLPLHPKFKKVFCLSEWHCGYFLNIFPQFKDITVPFYYGIDVNKFQQIIPKVPYKFIYSSFPNRGLLELLQMWPKIVNRFPAASLHIYADVDGKWVNSVEKEKMVQIRQLLNYYKNVKTINIHSHGWVSKSELANAWLTSEYWFYPCTFMETFCLTAVEAALSKTVCITNGLAALQNTVGNRGITVEGDASKKEWQDNALSALFSIMENKGKRDELIKANYEWASKLSWENQAAKLVREHIYSSNSQFIPYFNNPEYKDIKTDVMLDDGGMKNWTHDLPVGQGAKATFEKVLKHFADINANKSTEILEVGTYAGVSLIEIVKRIPNSKATAVDRWISYEDMNLKIVQNKDMLKVDEIHKAANCLTSIDERKIEQKFYSNIKASGLDNRIQGVKGDSHTVLLDFVKKGKMFDFIYVDGSHKCLDVATDLFLSWQLLQNGGIMAIDDYFYTLETNFDVNPLEYPYHAINAFLEKYKDNIIILEKGYRVFIKKSTFGKG
jgi:predicted O-methyltransferase YrrM/tetratricopeptide (TPR) repeat protein